MRNLKKHLERIYRKVALKLVKGEEAGAATAADGTPQESTSSSASSSADAPEGGIGSALPTKTTNLFISECFIPRLAGPRAQIHQC